MCQLLLLLSTLATTSARAATAEPSAQDADCTPAAALALGAQQMCGGAPIATALLSVRVQAHERTEQALAALGFREAMDLQLLAGKPEAEELMAELKVGGGLSIPDRAKLRLLIGARAEDHTAPPPIAKEKAGNRPLGECAIDH